VSARGVRSAGRQARKDNLPHQLTPFINREKELGALSKLVFQQRLVSLLGPAGTGKTRLALQLAEVVKRRFSDGVWLVELAPLQEAELLPSVIATTLGIEEVPTADPLAALAAGLESRRLLLVLDNSEHLVEPVAFLVDGLLRACPQLAVLVTSRERLAVDGEMAWRVAPLETPLLGRRYAPAELARVAAVLLFVDRARRSGADFTVTSENASAVAEMVRSLDGLPLAIELAAAWTGTLSPADLRTRLADRFGLLTARGRSMNPRHASLRVAIDSSYEALAEPEKRLFRQLGLFAGGWTLESMRAVCETDPEGEVELLARLVDRSLVTVIVPPSGPTRYRMLDSLRAYALDRLRETDEEGHTRRRFAEHLLGFAETAAQSLTRRDGPLWLQALDADYDNCRSVLEMDSLDDPELRLRLAVALLDYWQFRGHFAEGRLWLTLLTESAREKTVTLARAWSGLGYFEWAQADMAPAMRHCRRGLAMSRRLGDSRALFAALQQLAQICFDLNDLRGARRRLAKAMEIARLLGDDRQVAICLCRLGQFTLVEERWDEAETLLTQALDLARKSEDAELLAVTTIVLGRLHIRQGRLELAERISAEGLIGLRGHGSPRPTAHLMESLAAAAAARGEAERAARLAGAAASTFGQAGTSRPEEAPLHAPVVALWRSALSTEQGQQAWSEGHEMGLREAIDYALRESAAPVAPRPAASDRPGLTARQLEIARLVAEGLTNRQIAAALHISERTAEGHLEQIRNKLGFTSRVQIATWFIHSEHAE
jgi:predicted ATPase/DNA-binding CsgD family transcriptional regulator